MSITTRKALHWIVNTLFPVHCVHCGHEGKWLCRSCFQKITFKDNYCCPWCGRFSFYGHTCPQCRQSYWLNGVWVVGEYENAILNNCIKKFKFKGIKDLAHPLSVLVSLYKKNNRIQKEFDVIVPVPLHARRMLSRGYNQSTLLAKKISLVFHGKIHEDIIIRVKDTSPQTHLNMENRLKNIQGAFTIIDKTAVQGKKILLIDDVMTTGATLNECAKELAKAGASEIWGIVLARG